MAINKERTQWIIAFIILIIFVLMTDWLVNGKRYTLSKQHSLIILQQKK